MTNKDDLLKHCWAMFDYWMSSDYQGTSDERFAMMMNGMWSIIKEIGRPEAKFDSFGKQFSPPDLGISVSDGIGAEDKFGGA